MQATALLLVALTGMAQGRLYQSIGNVQSTEKLKDGILLKTTFGQYRIKVYSPGVVRVTATKEPQFDDFSYAVVAPSVEQGFKFTETASAITLTTDSLRLEVSFSPVRIKLFDKANRLINEDEPAFGSGWHGEQSVTHKKLQKDERFIGLGEKTGPLNRRGEGYTNWNTDFFAYPAGADPIYQTLPFYIGAHSGVNYGIFMDNSHKSHFNFGASNDRFASYTAEAGDMDYYLISHSKVADIINSYSILTGKMPMPPLWGLGLQQCRYSYYPDKEVIRIAETFREKGIPADAIVLDIHHMEKYKVFTWDKERFSNPKTMNDQLKKLGFNTVVIIDPGVKVEKGYAAYDEGVKENLFLKYPDKTDYSGQVWPGWCHFPDFTNPKTRNWWGKSFKSYTDVGVEGFWNDMNEPATWGQRFPDLVEFDFEGKKGSHRQGHNVYGLKMVESTYLGAKQLLGRRPFILTRAGYSGIQRYSAVWTGDNVASDDHMMAGVRLLNSMGLTGVPYTGMDVGGFTGGASKELFGRWVTIGAFSPFFRIHSAINTKESDPWSYGEEIEAISKNYISLRYRLLPYLYSTFYDAHKSGMPINRSLAINYTHDANVYDGRFQNQFFFGPGLLVCPEVSTKTITKVYLPDDNGWYDLLDDKFYAAKGEYFVDCPIEKLPVFVRGGSIVPAQTLVESTQQQPKDTLFLHVYKGRTGSSFVYYEDDGSSYNYEKDGYYRRTITYDAAKKSIAMSKSEGSFASKFKNLKLVLHGFGNEVNLVSAAGKSINMQTGNHSWVGPLPHFDPVGSGKPAPVGSVKQINVSLSNDKMEFTWK